jgi:hypothetical protein
VTSLPQLVVLALGAVGLGAVAWALVASLPTQWLFGAYFVAQVSLQAWTVSDVSLDSVDLALAVLAVAVLVQGLPRSPRGAVPHLALWLVLAALLTMSYAASPSGEEMTDPVRAAYQIYRYALRLVLVYPVACLLLDSGRKFDDVLACIVLATLVFAGMAIVQAYGGQPATGPFKTKNGLGAALAVGTVLAFVEALSGRRWMLAAVAMPVLLRGLLFASSRGAFAGTAVGIAVAGMALFVGGARMRLVSLAAAAVAAATLAFVVRPDLLQRPNVVRLFTTVDLEEENLVWRMQERWPWFFRRVLERPLLGWGEAVDESLDASNALTAHNGYLSLAVTSGVPVLVIYLLFTALAGRDVLLVLRRAGSGEDCVRAARFAGGLACMFTHSMVDAVIVTPFVGGALWVFIAGAGVLARPASNAGAEASPVPEAA